MAGIFRSADLAPENFVTNPEFVEVLHRVIREHAPTTPGFAEALLEYEGGSLFIIDQRTPNGQDGKVPPEDIVGAFAVKDGAGTYHANPNYRVFTKNGLVRLPGPLQQLLINELTRLTMARSKLTGH